MKYILTIDLSENYPSALENYEKIFVEEILLWLIRFLKNIFIKFRKSGDFLDN